MKFYKSIGIPEETIMEALKRFEGGNNEARIGIVKAAFDDGKDMWDVVINGDTLVAVCPTPDAAEMVASAILITFRQMIADIASGKFKPGAKED